MYSPRGVLRGAIYFCSYLFYSQARLKLPCLENGWIMQYFKRK